MTKRKQHEFLSDYLAVRLGGVLIGLGLKLLENSVVEIHDPGVDSSSLQTGRSFCSSYLDKMLAIVLNTCVLSPQHRGLL